MTAITWGEGIVLRYGGLYGPGTAISLAPDAHMAALVRKRRFPIIGDRFALPGLALGAVAIVVLLIPLLIGAILAAPILLVRRWWHLRDHTVVAGTRGDREASGASNARAPVTVEARPTIRDAA